MDFDELNDFADWENKRVSSFYKKTNEQMLELNKKKISKSMKEFSIAIKKKDRFQSSKKFAEIVVFSSLLAKRLNLDISQSVENQVEMMRSRRYE